MTPTEIINACQALGVSLSLDQGKLKVSDPKGMLSAALKAELAKNKEGVAAELRRSATPTQTRRNFDPKLIAAGVAGILILVAVSTWHFLGPRHPAATPTHLVQRPEPTRAQFLPIASSAAITPRPTESLSLVVPTASRTLEPPPVKLPATRPAPSRPARPTVPDHRDVRSEEPLDLSDPEAARRFRLLDETTRTALTMFSEHLKDPNNPKYHLNGEGEALVMANLNMFNRVWLREHFVRIADKTGVQKLLKVCPRKEEEVLNVKLTFAFLSLEEKMAVLQMVETIEKLGMDKALDDFRSRGMMDFVQKHAFLFGL